jgi:hypothetical protein
LAASFLGHDIVKLSLTDNEEAFRRQLGIALTSGHRFFVFDELGKTPNLIAKVKSILEISESVDWRPLFENRLVKTQVRGAFFFPCVAFPDFLVASPEFNRRTRHVHLHFQIPDWAGTSGGDTTIWRDRTEANARVANSILTHVLRLCDEYAYRFNS